MHAFVPNDFTLPPGARGFDFGPADADVMPGFDPVLPTDGRVTGDGMRGLHRPGDNRLLSDGIIGLRRFSTPMENGLHRILLITDDTGDESTLLSPLGNRIVVNSKVINLGDHPATDWLREAAGSRSNWSSRPEPTADRPISSAQSPRRSRRGM